MHAPSQAQVHAAVAATKKPKYKVTQMDGDNAAGLWVTEEGKETPCVAIYLGETGPVVGVYGKNSAPGCAAALSVCPDSGQGILQLVTSKGVPLLLTADKVEQLFKLIEDKPA